MPLVRLGNSGSENLGNLPTDTQLLLVRPRRAPRSPDVMPVLLPLSRLQPHREAGITLGFHSWDSSTLL